MTVKFAPANSDRRYSMSACQRAGSSAGVTQLLIPNTSCTHRGDDGIADGSCATTPTAAAAVTCAEIVRRFLIRLVQAQRGAAQLAALSTRYSRRRPRRRVTRTRTYMYPRTCTRHKHTRVSLRIQLYRGSDSLSSTARTRVLPLY